MSNTQSQFSITALAIANAVPLAFHTGLAHFVNPTAAQMHEDFVGTAVPRINSWLSWSIIAPILKLPYSWQRSLHNVLLHSGYPEHVVTRKNVIEGQIRDQIAGGTTQIIITGGGLDSLALRLSKEFPNVNFFEMDHGSTFDHKQGRINARFPSYKSTNLHYIQCHIDANTIMPALRSNTYFYPSAKTAVLMEGFTTYQTTDALKSLLTTLSTNLPNSDVIIGFLEPTPISWLNSFLRSNSGEAYKCIVKPEHVPALMQQGGYEMTGKSIFSDMHRPTGITDGSGIRESYYTAKVGSGPAANIASVPDISSYADKTNWGKLRNSTSSTTLSAAAAAALLTSTVCTFSISDASGTLGQSQAK